MIREDLFVNRMTKHWTSLGNCSSPDLQKVWGQLCRTFNEQIVADDSVWRVVQPATGTGKSQGLALYAAMHREQPEVGILIVVRLIAQAEEMADQINRLAGAEIAKTRHSDQPLNSDEMSRTQVLIITHRAYELSLDKYSRGFEQRFSSFMDYKNCFEGKRALVVIDECLDIVKQYQVSLDDLSYALGAIPYQIKGDPQFMSEIAQLRELEQRMMEIADSGNQSERMIPWSADERNEELNLDELRRACREASWQELPASVSEYSPYCSRVALKIDKILEAAEASVNQWRFYSKRGKVHTANTSALLVPDNIKGAVVLDATASQNLLYRLFSDRVIVKPVVEARRYDNVNLHVYRIRGVGKGAMKQKALPRVTKVFSYLAANLPEHAKALICSHQAIEPMVQQFDVPFEVRTGHWGAIDGRNDFQDCDTFVCLGLPYRDKVLSNNVYFAFKGPQGDDWFQRDSLRSDHGFSDIRKAIEEGQVASDVIQAINRICVRRVIDEYGNCKPANCYLLLGTDRLSDRLLETIQRAMPGIRVREWHLDMDAEMKQPKRSRTVHRSKYAEPLCTFMKGLSPGRYSSSIVREALKLPTDSWKALTKQLKTEDSNLHQRLAEMGWRYFTEGTGRGARSYFLKSE